MIINIIEVSEGKYELRVRVPKMSTTQYNAQAKVIEDKYGGEIIAQNKQGYKDEIAALQKEMEGNYEIKNVPLRNLNSTRKDQSLCFHLMWNIELHLSQKELDIP